MRPFRKKYKGATGFTKPKKPDGMTLFHKKSDVKLIQFAIKTRNLKNIQTKSQLVYDCMNIFSKKILTL